MANQNALLNLRELNKEYKQYIEMDKEDIAKSIEKVGFVFLQRLQIDTPEDLGRAAGGWIAKVDTSAPSEWKPPKGLKKYPKLDFPMGVVKFDSQVWISNNVPYVEYLDEGHSQQKPNGFTHLALRHVTLFIQKEVKRLSKKKHK